MGYALYAQYVLGLAPCPLCIFQRVATIVTGILFLIAAIHNPRTTGARVYGALIGLAALCGMLIGAVCGAIGGAIGVLPRGARERRAAL